MVAPSVHEGKSQPSSSDFTTWSKQKKDDLKDSPTKKLFSFVFALAVRDLPNDTSASSCANEAYTLPYLVGLRETARPQGRRRRVRLRLRLLGWFHRQAKTAGPASPGHVLDCGGRAHPRIHQRVRSIP